MKSKIKREVRKDIGLLKIGFKTAIQYRMHFFVGLLTSPISLLIYWFLWKSIFSYSGQSVINSFTLTKMINYFSLNIIIGIITWTFVDEWIAEDVRYGEVIAPLLRPVNFFKWYFFGEKGDISFRIVIEAIPIFIISVIFFKLKVYSTASSIYFLISLVFAIIIAFLFSYILGLSAFWLKKISGLRRMRRAVLSFLGGGLIPLTFFPLIIQKISWFLPFQYIRYVPISIYLENITGIYVFYTIFAQIIWIIILYFIAFLIYKKAIRKFTGEGT